MTDFSPAQPPEPQPQSQPQPAAPPRSKATVVLASVAVVFFLVAATFGTLWIMERGDHKETSGQLTAVRTEVEGERAKVKAAEAKTQEAVNERQKLQQTNESMKACVDAGKAILKAILENNEAAGEAAGQALALSCG